MNKKLNTVDSALLLTDDETRTGIISKRFALILEKQIDYSFTDSKDTGKFVKTRFSSKKNYLWDKCKYFKETEDFFYVNVFLKTGKVKVGHQLFIDKTDEEKYENIQVINTQTAFLLADLNDQTQVFELINLIVKFHH